MALWWFGKCEVNNVRQWRSAMQSLGEKTMKIWNLMVFYRSNEQYFVAWLNFFTIRLMHSISILELIFASETSFSRRELLKLITFITSATHSDSCLIIRRWCPVVSKTRGQPLTYVASLWETCESFYTLRFLNLDRDICSIVQLKFKKCRQKTKHFKLKKWVLHRWPLYIQRRSVTALSSH